MTAIESTSYSPTVRRGDLHWFKISDAKDRTVNQIRDLLYPLGVRFRVLKGLTVFAYRAGSGEICVQTGALVKWKDNGTVVVNAYDGTTEAQRKALLLAAERAATEDGFLKGSWTHRRATSKRGAYSVVTICDTKPDDDLSAALRVQLDEGISSSNRHSGRDSIDEVIRVSSRENAETFEVSA
ncbi:hypothetical protein DWB68_15315 [Galactobacter valiniphilus]|uniref:Uncharacterized protein n=1 Tax=Galactobacter valiniphilus TaxID=2676122 RepID=A0A399J6I4_9MICC|nr:hypothetical protein [Galactobacter valiniphilus]RII40934.1 hypothetical protein DWB68_15315 [Galactobacter valiniphilus]